jgi:hypothetical protein
MLVAVGRDGELPSHPVSIEHEGVGRQSGQMLEAEIAEVRIEKGLYAPIGGREPVTEQTILFPEVFEGFARQIYEGPSIARINREAEARELDVDI